MKLLVLVSFNEPSKEYLIYTMDTQFGPMRLSYSGLSLGADGMMEVQFRKRSIVVHFDDLLHGVFNNVGIEQVSHNYQ